MKLPVSDVMSVLGATRGAASQGEPTNVLVCVGASASSALVSTLRSALVPDTTLANVDVVALSAASLTPLSGYDAVLVLPGCDRDDAAVVAASASAGNVPCALLVESSVEGAASQPPAGNAPVAVIAGSSPEALLQKLAEWMSGSCRRDVDLAAAFPFVRAAEARKLVRSCAATNAAVGLVGLLGGADLPVMAANQARMAYDLRRVRSGSSDPGTLAPVVAAVAVCGIASRAVARRATRNVGPFAPAVRAGVAYLGTLACGAAVVCGAELAARRAVSR